MFFPASAWFSAFVLTVLIEAPVAWFLLRAAEPSLVRLGLLIVFASVATHPAVWFVFTQLFLVGTLEYVIAAEGWAVVAESVFWWAAIRGLSARRAVAVGVGTNVVSFLVGRLVLGLWPGLLW